MDSLSKDEYWIAVQVQPRHEHLVSTQLSYKGYEEFLPCCPSTANTANSRQRRPLFPGYLFCKFHPLGVAARIVTTPGVVRILSIAGHPVEVREEEIAALRKITISSIECIPCPYLELGNHVRIVNGPLAGITGILTQMERNPRLVVSIQILKRAVSLQIQAQDVAPSTPS